MTNGVRQGGILSPYLFSIYVDDLSEQLNECKTGCKFNDLLVNHLMYADDLVILAPSAVGLSMLLKACEKFGVHYVVKFNAKKSAVMVFRSKTMKDLVLPDLNMYGEKIQEVTKTKCNIITNDLTDDADIDRQVKKLYAQGNSILRKFHMCSWDVKLTLFRAYCSPLYTAQLWWSHKRASINRLKVPCHNLFKMFLGLPKYESTSLLCTALDVQCCQAVIRRLIYNFIMVRLAATKNSIIILHITD